MKFPVDLVFRNELLRSGKNLGVCSDEQEFAARLAKYKEEAKRSRRFAVWVAIDKDRKEVEVARGEA